MAIRPKLYKIVGQFAEVSNFSEVPLQSSLKNKHLLESYWAQGEKVKNINGIWTFCLKTCSGTMSHRSMSNINLPQK